MAKLSKAKARKRLREASNKISKVWMNTGRAGLTERDMDTLLKCRKDLNRIADKMK